MGRAPRKKTANADGPWAREKTLNITHHQGNANQTHRCPFTRVRGRPLEGRQGGAGGNADRGGPVLAGRATLGHSVQAQRPGVGQSRGSPP